MKEKSYFVESVDCLSYNTSPSQNPWQWGQCLQPSADMLFKFTTT